MELHGDATAGSKVVVHCLSIKKGVSPKKQPQQHCCPQLVTDIKKAVSKLIESGFIREVEYPMWIVNIVPVRKKNRQLHICVNFHNLNDTCTKDGFLVPVMELMIDEWDQSCQKAFKSIKS